MLPRQVLRGLLFDYRPLEEVRIRAGPQTHRVAEDEVAEIVLAKLSVVDEFMRLGEDCGHVRNIKMADIRPHDGVKLDVEGIGL